MDGVPERAIQTIVNLVHRLVIDLSIHWSN